MFAQVSRRCVTRCVEYSRAAKAFGEPLRVPAQRLCTRGSDDTGVRDNKKSGSKPEEKDLFHPNNVAGLSSLEVARMRLTYGLLKEHVAALQQGTEVNVENNPLIDPRSFDIRKLPELPKEVLAQFRKELPSEVAATSRPLSTHGIWEKQKDGSGSMNPERVPQDAKEWAAVDERTMDPAQFARMQRLSLSGSSLPISYASPIAGKKGKVKCPLADERGTVRVDFRGVGRLSTYLTEGGKIIPKRTSGLRAKAQRKVSRAIKTARTMALIHPEPKPKLTVEEMIEIDKTLP